MALSTPSESPAVVVKEIDLTGGVPNVQSTTGAIVGNFRWGPVEERKRIANETELAATFANPDSDNTIDFHSATYFLRYSSSGVVVRAVTSAAKNAFSSTRATLLTGGEIVDGDLQDGGLTAPFSFSNTKYSADSQNTLRLAQAATNHAAQSVVVKNETNWDEQQSSLADITDELAVKADSDGAGNLLLDSDATNAFGGNNTFIAKYPGALGNSLRVSICPPNSAAFAAWDYKEEFDGAPGTSAWDSDRGGSNDEVHVAVIDKNGAFTGTSGSVLETYAYASVVKNALTSDQANNYVKDIINNRSEYVWMANFDSDYRAAGAGDNAPSTNAPEVLDSSSFNSADNYDFHKGANSGALGTSEFLTGFDQFEDKDQVEVDFLIAPGMTSREAQTTVVNDLISTAQQTRKDCVVVTSPARSDVVNQSNVSTIINNVVSTADTFTNSSYLVTDNNYLKVYDKYNDQYIFIPAASSTAGIMAATDLNRAPWFSPAGSRRGQYLGITSIAYTPTKGQRDTLYKASVNPIANIPGQGVLLYGDKTGLSRPSAFDRINVRRLFLILERAIGRAAQQVLFEFNDEFTRAEFVNIIEPVLREIKGRRGITDFRVVADETNNTPEVIDRNEFIANIFIKPARSINYVTLNFVAVRTGVDFEEVVGTV
jgi:hypothetical protein